MLNLFEQVGRSAKAWVEWKRFLKNIGKAVAFEKTDDGTCL